MVTWNCADFCLTTKAGWSKQEKAGGWTRKWVQAAIIAGAHRENGNDSTACDNQHQDGEPDGRIISDGSSDKQVRAIKRPKENLVLNA